MSESYPLHLLVLTRNPDYFNMLIPRFDQVGLTGSIFKALKLHRSHPYQLILIEPKTHLKIIGKLLAHIFKIPTLVHNHQTHPLKFDLEPFWKPVTYHPQIKHVIDLSSPPSLPTLYQLHSAELLIMPPEGSWGPVKAQAAAAGVVTVTPDPHLVSYLVAHPEEVYRIAKNNQQRIKNRLESHILPEFLAKKLYNLLAPSTSLAV